MRTLIVSLVAAVALVGVAPPASGAPAVACVEPTATYRYTAVEMVYELAVDYRGCSWWQGTSAVLDGFLAGQQAGGVVSTLEFETAGVAFCEEPEPVVTCSLAITLAHASPELAQYSGRISYPWEDGRRSQEFAATCFSVAGQASCRPEGAS
jgi:hypothetical protein